MRNEEPTRTDPPPVLTGDLEADAAASLGWSTDTLTEEVFKAHERTQQGTPAGRFAAFANHLMNAAETRTAQAA